jgi:8-oxo-dGTP pyrophosphatase MutT (NUDIX family)
MELKPRYSAGLAIIYDNKILLGHTTGRKSDTGYGIPKGGIEDGESNIDAAIRETYEELGLKIKRSLIDTTEYTFTVTSRKYKYNKVVYYFVVKIDSLSQIGLKDLEIPKNKLQIKEIDHAAFFDYETAKNVVMYTQSEVINKMLGKGLIESKTIAGKTVESNQESNEAQQGIGEDPRLLKIRQFKATIKDFKSYWDGRATENN